jgi:MFS family permease
VAYLGDLFPSSQRSKANGVINLMGGLGGAAALLGGGALYKMGAPLPFIVGAGVMIIAVIIVLLFVKEPKPEDVEQGEMEESAGLVENLKEVWGESDKRGVTILLAIFLWFVGWNAMEAFFTIYARNVLGVDPGTGTQMLTAFAAALILFAIPSGYIATWFGRKRTILVGLAGMLVGLGVGFFIRDAKMMLILLAVMGAFWALVNINSLPIVYDVGGEERIGAYTGLYYFASSLAAISGPILAGVMIDFTNHAMIWLFSAVFMLLAFVAMLRLQEKKPLSHSPNL